MGLRGSMGAGVGVSLEEVNNTFNLRLILLYRKTCEEYYKN